MDSPIHCAEDGKAECTTPDTHTKVDNPNYSASLPFHLTLDLRQAGGSRHAPTGEVLFGRKAWDARQLDAAVGSIVS